MSMIEPDDALEQKQEIAGLFSRAAPTYDRIGPRFFSHFGQRLVGLAQIPGGVRVLDVATGKGAVLIPAVEAVGPLGTVIGIDISDEMVQETAMEIDRLKLVNAEVHQMDAEYLQFQDATFDCVTCGFAIFFFPQFDRALAELRRVLKPKGMLAITSWDQAFDDEQWKWFEELVNIYIPQETGQEKPAESTSTPKPDLTSQEGLKQVLTTAGFDVTLLVSETAEFFYSSVEEWWSSLWSHGMRSTLEEIQDKTGANGLERFRTAVFDRVQDKQQPAGIPYAARAIYVVAVKQ